ncbi:MAG: lipid kinase [Proteobacteria bacterium]|nr:lipid kinase [Pseudomonadota bacterium]
MARRALLIVNENSRQGQRAAQTAEMLLQKAGLHVLRERSNGPSELDALIRKHAATVNVVALGGGDGTFNGAAHALIDTGLTLGILPLGTGNDLARTLNIPMDLATAVDTIVAGKTHHIDLGDVNGRPFFNVASFGLSVRLTRNLTSDVKRRWGRLGYAIALLRALIRARPFSAEIVCGGTTQHVRTLQIAVGNGRHYGAGMTVEEDARIDDGVLNLYSLEFDHPWSLLLIYPAFRKGKHGVWKQVRTLKCSEVEIRTHKPRSINTDGEITTHTPARFKVIRRAVKVFVP